MSPTSSVISDSEAASAAQLRAAAADHDSAAPAVAPAPDLEPDAPGEPKIPTADVLHLLLVPLAERVAPAWALTAAELRSLADAWGVVLDKYFPDLNLGVELQAAIVTFAVFGPRWGTPRRPPAPEPAPDAPRSTRARPPDPPPKPGVIPADALAP